ncbi:hypothetical protein ACFX1T_002879 [Malus domestica]
MSRVMDQVNDAHLEKVMAVCNGLFEDMVDQLNDSLTSMDVNQSEKLLSVAKINNKKIESSSTVLHHLFLSPSLSLRSPSSLQTHNQMARSALDKTSLSGALHT